MGIREIFGEVRGHAIWHGLTWLWEWLWPIFGPLMISLALAIYQKLQNQPFDLWLLVIAFVVAFALFAFSLLANKKQSALNSRQNVTSLLHEQGGLIIHYAGYGLGFGQYRDVTERVRRLIENKKLHMRVDTESLQCEAYSGQSGKHLFIIYSHGVNEGMERRADVYQLIELP